MMASRRFFSGALIWVRTRNPVFRALPTYSQTQECLTDGFNTHHALGETLLKADVRRQSQGPDAGLFSIDVWWFMQDGAQRFTFGLIKLSQHRFRSGRLLFETSGAFVRVSMNGIAHGLGGTAQILCDDFGTLASTGGEQDLAAT